MSGDDFMPSPWRPAPPGFRIAVVVDEHWEVPAVGSGRCRLGASRYQGACGRPAVATLWRNRHTRNGPVGVPWDYCAEHLYGRWLEGGKVMCRRLVPDKEEEVTRDANAASV